MSEMTEKEERRREIGKTISQAMQQRNDLDFSADTPKISEKFDDLQEAMANYIDGAGSRAECKTAYKEWVNSIPAREISREL